VVGPCDDEFITDTLNGLSVEFENQSAFGDITAQKYSGTYLTNSSQ